MEHFEKSFSGTSEEARLLFEKMRKAAREGIADKPPVPPEFDIPVPVQSPEPPRATKDAPAPAKPAHTEFHSGAQAMADWERQREEAEERRIREAGNQP